MRKILNYVVLFAIIEAVLISAVNEYTKNRVNEYLLSASKIIDIEYSVIYNSYVKLLRSIFDETINNDDIKLIIYDSYGKNKQDKSREILYEKLKESYARLKKLNIRQLHFHDRTNHSFLRMHKPEKFGDDLSDVRYSVNYVNEYKKEIHGFEGGRVHNGFRFVFPLFYKDEHIGSVEASLSSAAFTKELESSFEQNAFFIISKSIVASKVWENDKSIFIKSPISDEYLMDKKYALQDSATKELFASIKEKIEKNFKSQNTFSTCTKLNDEYYLISFKPIDNVQLQKAAAYIITYHKDNSLKQIFKDNDIYSLILTILNILVLLLVYKARQVRRKIEFENKKREVILDNQEDIVILCDENKNIIQINKKFFDLFDFKDKRDFLSKHRCVCELFLDEKEYMSINDLDNILDDTTDTIHKALMVDKHSNRHVFKVNHKKITIDDEIFYLQTISDITILEDALHVTQEMIKTKALFMANMSHEIRTPMNAIMGFTQLLLKMEIEPKVKKYIDIIGSSSKTLLALINDILDFSKLESGSIELDLVIIDTKKEFESILALFELKCEENGIKYIKKIDEKLPSKILLDIHKFKQILINLIGNAIKFTDRGGSVEVTIKYEERASIFVSVKDSGIGISSEQKEKIFNAFTQADGSTTRKYGGTGLGLSISKSLVSLMGGELLLESELGKGSMFYFKINLENKDDA